MTGPQARGPPGGRRQPSKTARKNLIGTISRTQDKLIGLLLYPFQATFLTIHPNTQPLQMPRRHHTGPHHPFRSIIEAQLDVGVVINLAAWHNTGQLGGHFGDFQTGDEASQVLGVCPQITDHAGFPDNAGSSAPNRLFMARRFQQRSGPARSVLDLYQPDLAQLSIANHRTGLTYHRIAAIAVGHAENLTRLAYQAHQLKSMLHIRSQGFVADHIDTVFQEGFSDSVMAVIRRHNADYFNTILPLSLRLGHLLPRAIATLWHNAQRSGEVAAALGF